MSMRAISKPSRLRRGTITITGFMLMSLLSIGAMTYLNSSTLTITNSNRQMEGTQTTHLCDAGVQATLRILWVPFKINQKFDEMESACAGASAASPRSANGDLLSGVGRYSAAVIGYSAPDTYSRYITIRSVGWIDRDNDGVLDVNESTKTIDVVARYELTRSQVFDYTYFINNYGWWDGFSETDAYIQGDMRANGNFNFLNGSPTANGSVIAAANTKLVPGADGQLNTAPVKWANTTYTAFNPGNNPVTGEPRKNRMRQAYNSTTHGAYGTALHEKWRDYVFDSTAGIINNRPNGALAGDVGGIKGWQRLNTASAATYTVLDSSPTSEVIMPDLSNLAYYQNLSSTYRDPKATYADGTPNPDYNQPAYVEVWNSGLGVYQRISTNGNVTGSALLIGTSAKPIKIHGPVTFSQDCVIKGYVQGQGTIYTGRNVHIIGSIRYKNPPNFLGDNFDTVEQRIEKNDMLALAARASVIMGDVRSFTAAYPLQYMRPPFTKPRYDDLGNLIPAYDATQVDSYGTQRYKSVMGDAVFANSESVNELSCIMYTNFVGGGNIGQGGNGCDFNGSIISKDEAMVVWSLPMRMHYDHRIRERRMPDATYKQLIDLSLPRSPRLVRNTWQERSFRYAR